MQQPKDVESHWGSNSSCFRANTCVTGSNHFILYNDAGIIDGVIDVKDLNVGAA
ncbi:hypothetical protein NVIE_1954 [Nitrososphaera viennensis EN76]|uniref:Uncharacterized protein n=1 Tax=Nitrososphaera viennensis EN76 TaxID=926571 RepID=A0A060HLR5_9ARCH|nr:hypothetical protein NVIE_1954 [Nitrososphaera viennensis EN76]